MSVDESRSTSRRCRSSTRREARSTRPPRGSSTRGRPELLEWALEQFHPKMAISAAGGVDGMALVDMAWRINPEVRVFTLDTGRLPPETYQLFEDVRDQYGIDVEFEFPDRTAIEEMVFAAGPNLMYRSVEPHRRAARSARSSR